MQCFGKYGTLPSICGECYQGSSCIRQTRINKNSASLEAKDTSVVTEKTERSTAMDSDIARAMKEMGCVDKDAKVNQE